MATPPRHTASSAAAAVEAPPNVAKAKRYTKTSKARTNYDERYPTKNEFGIPVPSTNLSVWEPGLMEPFEFDFTKGDNGGLLHEARRRYSDAKAKYNAKRASMMASQGGRRKKTQRRKSMKRKTRGSRGSRGRRA